MNIFEKVPRIFLFHPLIQRWKGGTIFQALILTFKFPNEGANLWRENSNSKANFGSTEEFFSI